jgi:hypothetical protein
MDTDADQDPAIFVSDLQESTKNKCFLKVFFAYYLLFVGTFTSFFKDKKI